jgi:GNAT superfamily N-acetyltransferase
MVIRVEYQPAAQSAEDIHRIDAECFPDEPMDERTLAAATREDLWVARYDGTIAGFAYLLRRPGVSWLSRLGTASTHRRHGIGTALLQAVLEHCSRIGLPTTILYVQTDNPDAIRLYERFGFRSEQSTWQFVLYDPQERLRDDRPSGIVADPICDVPPSAVPAFPGEWESIASMHNPPDTYVLVFRDGGHTIGYCRLNPGFPGCFPFSLDQPTRNLMPALRAMRRYLRPEMSLLKLTVSDSALAGACAAAGLALNYELLKMYRRPGTGR